MDDERTITVFSFKTFADAPHGSQVAPFKATRSAITDVFMGQVLEGTGEQVPVDEVDSRGVYRRIPTGWGELGG